MIDKYLTQYEDDLKVIGPLYQGKGDFPDPVVFIDGGAKFKNAEGISVGDNDSFTGKLDVVLSPDKDQSDLAFLLSKIPRSFKKISFFGFLGGRKDHELMNLGEISRFLNSRENTRVLIEKNIIAVSSGKWTFNIQRTFSLFSFEENTVSLSGGCKYELNQAKLRKYSSHGLSNEGHGETQIRCSEPLFIFL